MDAKDLLHAVGERYANLTSFPAEILSISESGDEASFNRGEQRSRAFFVAPDKIRLEQGGSRGSVTVTNGVDVAFERLTVSEDRTNCRSSSGSQVQRARLSASSPFRLVEGRALYPGTV